MILHVPANLSRASFAASPQGAACSVYITRICGRHDYMAFIDSDEFIVINEEEEEEDK